MAYLIAVVFDDEAEAGRVRNTIHQAQKGGQLTLDDSAVVVRDQEGKLHIKEEVDRGVKVGTLWGSLIGLLLSGILFPFFGLALGAIGGALVGKIAGDSVDKDFVRDVGAKMEPGSSAIFYLFHGRDVEAAVAVLRPYQGEILYTTVDSETEERLRDELKSRIQ